MMSAPALDHAAMERLDLVGMLEIPKLRRLAGHQAHGEEIGAHGPIGEKEGPFGKKLLQALGHGPKLVSPGGGDKGCGR